MTPGPVMNICEVWSTMITKSVSAGEYTWPPAAAPMISEICGMTPEARVLRRKIWAYRSRETTPSWMRAPPPSLMPMIGQPVLMAKSMILTIFSP